MRITNTMKPMAGSQFEPGVYATEHKTSMLEGKLIQVGESGVMLELPTGRTFVPVSAILHISLPEGW